MSAVSRYRELLKPSYIGKVKTKNRIYKTGAHPGFFDYNDGYPDSRYKDLYRALAKGGVGLLMVGSACIDYPGGLLPKIGYRIDDDKYISGLREITDIIHEYDCPAFIQLFHMGPMYPSHIVGGESIAASALTKAELPNPNFAVPREMSVADIEQIIGKFVSAAVRLKKAGFDGVEINAGSAHLLNSFLSKAWNKRTDDYGKDSLENRARIIVDIIKGIKNQAGSDFPVAVLVNGAEIGLEDGITIEETKAFAGMFQSAGADAIQVRGEYYAAKQDRTVKESTHFPEIVFYPELESSLPPEIDGTEKGKGGWVPLAEAVKKVVTIPVIAIGRLDPDSGEKVLREGKADFIGMNRRLLADPELPNKLMQGRLEDIAPCTACLTCFSVCETQQHPRCRINPALGNYIDYDLKPAAQKKNVVVVGGGPAGMEAAIVAASRGHNVTLYEKENRLGGSIFPAAIIKGSEREDLESIITYLKGQIIKSGVQVKLNQEVTPELLKELKPDALVLATGGKHNNPTFPGESKHVLTSQDLHHRLKKYLKYFNPKTLHNLSRFWLPVGKRVVIIGGSIQGCQTAEFLVKRGRQVTLLEPGSSLGDGLINTFLKPYLLKWLSDRGTRIITGVSIDAVSGNGVIVTTREGKMIDIAADTVITALPLLPDHYLANGTADNISEIYEIGDCLEPGLIVDAIEKGAVTGAKI